MSISARGPRNILVIDRNCVPINEIISHIVNHRDIDAVLAKYSIHENEVFDAISCWCDVREPTENDFIKFQTEMNETGILDVETTGISDWMMLSCISFGKDYQPNESDLSYLYGWGLGELLIQSMTDIKNGTKDYEASILHESILLAFESSYKKVTPENAEEMIYSIELERSRDEVRH